MLKLKGLIGLVFLLYIGFSVFELKGVTNLSFIFESLIVPTITLYYILFSKTKNVFFLLFLLSYSLSDLLSIGIELITNGDSQFLYDIEYYTGNSLYMLAYIFLLIKICKSLNFKYVFEHFKIHLIVLSILNVYLLFVLQITIKSNVVVDFDYFVEYLYNIIIFVLMFLSFLNYFYKDNQKSLYLFVGALFTVFSEIIALAHIYITSINILSFLSTTLSLVAFFFFCNHKAFLNTSNKEISFVVLSSKKLF